MSTEYVVAALKFDKDTLGKAANDDSVTMLAIGLMLLSSVLQGALAAYNDDLGTFGALGIDTPNDATGFFLIGFIGQLIFVFFFAAMYSISLKIFGGSASVMQVIRIWGITTIWSIISILVGFLGLGIASLLGLLGLISFLIGVSAFSGKGVIVAFLAIILAIILTIILVFLLIVLVLGSLLL